VPVAFWSVIISWKLWDIKRSKLHFDNLSYIWKCYFSSQLCLLVISKSHPWLNYWHPPGSYRLCFSTEGGDTHTHTNSLPVPFNQHVWYCHRILYDPYFALYHVVRQKRYFTVGAFFMQTRGRIPGNRFQLNLVEVFFLKRKKNRTSFDISYRHVTPSSSPNWWLCIWVVCSFPV
jgi:hypothetical protein